MNEFLESVDQHLAQEEAELLKLEAAATYEAEHFHYHDVSSLVGRVLLVTGIYAEMTKWGYKWRLEFETGELDSRTTGTTSFNATEKSLARSNWLEALSKNLPVNLRVVAVPAGPKGGRPFLTVERVL